MCVSNARKCLRQYYDVVSQRKISLNVSHRLLQLGCFLGPDEARISYPEFFFIFALYQNSNPC